MQANLWKILPTQRSYFAIYLVIHYLLSQYFLHGQGQALYSSYVLMYVHHIGTSLGKCIVYTNGLPRP